METRSFMWNNVYLKYYSFVHRPQWLHIPRSPGARVGNLKADIEKLTSFQQETELSDCDTWTLGVLPPPPQHFTTPSAGRCSTPGDISDKPRWRGFSFFHLEKWPLGDDIVHFEFTKTGSLNMKIIKPYLYTSDFKGKKWWFNRKHFPNVEYVLGMIPNALPKSVSFNSHKNSLCQKVISVLWI